MITNVPMSHRSETQAFLSLGVQDSGVEIIWLLLLCLAHLPSTSSYLGFSLPFGVRAWGRRVGGEKGWGKLFLNAAHHCVLCGIVPWSLWVPNAGTCFYLQFYEEDSLSSNLSAFSRINDLINVWGFLLLFGLIILCSLSPWNLEIPPSYVWLCLFLLWIPF